MIEKIQRSMILSKIGIKQWVGASACTEYFDSTVTHKIGNEHVIKIKKTAIQEQEQKQLKVDSLIQEVKPFQEILLQETLPQETLLQEVSSQQITKDNIQIIQNSHRSANHVSSDIDTDETLQENQKKAIIHVQPFHLQAIPFANSILLLDANNMNALENELWHSICIGLKAQPINFTFPICKGMDSLEVATTSLLGFFYSLTHSHNQKIITLNQCLESFSDVSDFAIETLTLESMLTNVDEKAQLWKLINEKI